MWTGKDTAAHPKQPYQSPSSFSLAFAPSTDAIAAQGAPVSDEDSVWSAHEDESPGNAAFGSVDYVTGPVLTGPTATEEVEQDSMQIDSTSEQLQDAARLSSQHESGDATTEAGRQACSNPEGLQDNLGVDSHPEAAVSGQPASALQHESHDRNTEEGRQVSSGVRVRQDTLGVDSHPKAAVYGQPALALQHESQDRDTEAGRQVSSGVQVLQESADRAFYPEAASNRRLAGIRQQPGIYTQIARRSHGDISPPGGEDSAASGMRVHRKQATDATQILSAQQIGATLDGSQVLSSTPLYSCQLQGLGEVLPSLPGQDLAKSTGTDASLPFVSATLRSICYVAHSRMLLL